VKLEGRVMTMLYNFRGRGFNQCYITSHEVGRVIKWHFWHYIIYERPLDANTLTYAFDARVVPLPSAPYRIGQSLTVPRAYACAILFVQYVSFPLRMRDKRHFGDMYVKLGWRLQWCLNIPISYNNKSNI